MILAGDVGGTKTTLAVFDEVDQRLEVVERKRFASQDHESLDAIVGTFMTDRQRKVELACFGVAGPVKDGRSKTTNLPWIIDARALAAILGVQTVELINDLEANAYGIGVLRPTDFVFLNEGSGDANGNAAIIAAGTGLGEAGMYWDGRYHHPFGCEGGHTDFAPRNETEVELLRFMLNRFERVSYERILSGPGLYGIYQFLRDRGKEEEPMWLKEEIREGDRAAAISKAALSQESELCIRALDAFVSLYGAEAGNLALKVMASGGLFVGGGIAPKIIPKLEDGTFMEAFLDKGRMRPLLEAIPVRIVLNEQTALLGAAHCARLRAAGEYLSLRRF
jgi:glucokinase